MKTDDESKITAIELAARLSGVKKDDEGLGVLERSILSKYMEKKVSNAQKVLDNVNSLLNRGE